MIDLNTCVKGQKLKSKHGLILTYIGKLPEGHYYDHEVEYPSIPPYGSNSKGTRTNDGFVFRKNRAPEDHDIVEILPLTTDNN